MRSPATPPWTRSSARSSHGRAADQLGRPHLAVDRDAVAHALVDHVRRGRPRGPPRRRAPSPSPWRSGGRRAAPRRARVEGASRRTTCGHAAVVVAPAHDEHERDRRQRQRRRAERHPGRAPRAARAVVDEPPDHGPRRRVRRRRRAPRARAPCTAISTSRDPQLLAAREHRLLDPPAVDEGAVGRAEVAHAQAAGGLRAQLRVVARGPLVTDDEVAAAHATEDERSALLRRDLDGPPGVGAGQDPQPHGPGLISRRRRRPGACGA